ncbi:MAG TPA: LysR family transcriptional regulator substrate-binding protein, partial [Chthoniobacterales bacterium]|nr:LysR family transcriptional regulator substrate-binding protein [Chthoniobacterales bacterium]
IRSNRRRDPRWFYKFGQKVTRFPLVLLHSGFCTSELIDTGLDGSDVQPKILAEFDSIDAIVSCVQEVAAISVLPEHACR